MKLQFSLLALLACVCTLAAVLSIIYAGEESSQVIPIKYSSPQAVFDAYREAIGKRDWRTAYFCYTLESQKSAVFETYFASQERRQTKAIEDVLKKLTGGKSLEGAKPPDHADNAQVADFMYKVVDDPAAFFSEMNTVLHDADHPLDAPGKLHDVSVDGDTATGHTAVTIRSIRYEFGKQEKAIATTAYSCVRKTCQVAS
jgi:hypothetical protein